MIQNNIQSTGNEVKRALSQEIGQGDCSHDHEGENGSYFTEFGNHLVHIFKQAWLLLTYCLSLYV